MSSPCEWRVAGLFCAQVYQYLHYKQVLPAPFVWKMEIKKIIKAGSTEIDSQQNATLQPTDTVYSALNLFLKSKATCLPLYENNEFLGSVILTDLLEVVLQDYALEREKHYQLTVKLNYSLIRLQNLIGKNKNANLPNDRGHLIQLSLETIADSQKHLK